MPKGKESKKARTERYLRLQRLIEKELKDFFDVIAGGGPISARDITLARVDAVESMDPAIRKAGESSGLLQKVLGSKGIPLTDHLSVRVDGAGLRVKNSRTGKERSIVEVRQDSAGRYRDERGRFL